MSKLVIRPQPGMQEIACSSSADILILGGAAGGGKSFILEIEPLRHINNGKFGAVTFMRESTNITKQGSLWDKSHLLYPFFGAQPRERPALDWRFPSGMKITFSGMEHEVDRFKWKGAEIPLIQFDQLEAFAACQFWYMTSRLRSMSGVPGYIRASCNPDPDSFLAELISWWIDQNTGYAIDARSGVIRWFIRHNDEMFWDDDKDKLIQHMQDIGLSLKDIRPKSFTFVRAYLEENPALMERDPNYMSNLLSLPLVDRERLLKGNWKIRPSAGTIINRTKINLVAAAPRTADTVIVRAWDKASTEGGKKDRTSGFKMSRTDGRFYIESVIAERLGSVDREKLIRQTAQIDSNMERSNRSIEGLDCHVFLEQEGGSSGVTDTQDTVRNLAGYTVEWSTSTGSKIARVRPFATQIEAGNVFMVDGDWNEMALVEMHNFDGVSGHIDDIPDSGAAAFNYLANMPELLLG